MTRALIYIFVIAFVIYTTKTQECGENERYYSCGSCDTKCSDSGPMACTADCRPGECGCNAGYIRDDKSGKCIEPENCNYGFLPHWNSLYKPEEICGFLIVVFVCLGFERRETYH